MNLWYGQPPLYGKKKQTPHYYGQVSFVPGQRKLLPVAEPDLQIKGEEVGGGGGGGGGHPDPEIRGTGSSHQKNFFRPCLSLVSK